MRTTIKTICAIFMLIGLCSCHTTNRVRLQSDVRSSYRCAECDTFPIAGYEFRDLTSLTEELEVIVVYRDSLHGRTFSEGTYMGLHQSTSVPTYTKRASANALLERKDSLPNFYLYRNTTLDEIVHSETFSASLDLNGSDVSSTMAIPVREIEAVIPLYQRSPDEQFSKSRYEDTDTLASIGAGLLVIGTAFAVFVGVLFISFANGDGWD